jgi:hypothetical protein
MSNLKQSLEAAVHHHLPASHTSPLPSANPTISYWLSPEFSNPFHKHGENLPLPEKVDITIIGSGITGIWTAWKLVEGLKDLSKKDGETKKGERKKWSIAVVEAREFCSGATGISFEILK